MESACARVQYANLYNEKKIIIIILKKINSHQILRRLLKTLAFLNHYFVHSTLLVEKKIKKKSCVQCQQKNGMKYVKNLFNFIFRIYSCFAFHSLLKKKNNKKYFKLCHFHFYCITILWREMNALNVCFFNLRC